jgi:hypothetical protein
MTASTDECLNCNKRASELTLVPEFNFMGCDECLAEAMAVIAKEQAEAQLNAAIVAVLTRPMGMLELSDLVEEHAGVKQRAYGTPYNFVDICSRINEWSAMGKVVFDLVDGERIYSLAPERKAPGSVVWGDLNREVA